MGCLRLIVDWIIKFMFSPVKLEILVVVFILFWMVALLLKEYGLQLREPGQSAPCLKMPREHLSPASAVTLPEQRELDLGTSRFSSCSILLYTYKVTFESYIRASQHKICQVECTWNYYPCGTSHTSSKTALLVSRVFLGTNQSTVLHSVLGPCSPMTFSGC